MDLGEQIKKRRIELNITQEELANKLNVTRSAVSNWETEKNYPDLQTIVNISDELNISLDALLKGDRKLIDKITKDTNENPKLKKTVKRLTVVIICLCIIAIGAHFVSNYLFTQTYIPYSDTGIRVTDSGDMYADCPFFCSYTICAGTNNEVALIYLTRSNWKDKTTKERIAAYDNRKEDSFEKVYYLPEKYVKKYKLLKNKYHAFYPTTAELKEIEKSAELLWAKE